MVTSIPKPPSARQVRAAVEARLLGPARDHEHSEADRRQAGPPEKGMIAGFARGAQAAAEAFGAAYEQALSRLHHPPMACRKGCAFCCHTVVSALAPEIFALAETIDADEALAARVKPRVIARHRERDGKGIASGEARKLACPLLEPQTKLCSVHPHRPLTCRAMNSIDAAVCEAALADKTGTIAVPSHLPPHQLTQAYYDGLTEALGARGLDMRAVELVGGLAVVWTTETALDRWLAGEPVFAAVYANSPDDPPPTF